jgi:hypothetical protein
LPLGLAKGLAIALAIPRLNMEEKSVVVPMAAQEASPRKLLLDIFLFDIIVSLYR